MNAGRALAAVCADRAVLGRIGGSLGEDARRALDPSRRAEVLAAVRSPVPPGLRGVHETWIEAAIESLPPRARVVLAEGPLHEADVWLARRACARIPPLPAIEPALARPHTVGDILRMSPIALRDWLTEVGRDQLAFALGEHAAAVPELADARARIGTSPRLGDLGARRDAIERARGEAFVIGVRAIAPRLDLPLARALVLRFPHPDALGIAAELTAHRAGRSAAWSALIAP
ncbi:MAG: hypothetical protein H0T46_02775 [Deltaproteobacteria bacterium]|nr:hypothetical protein [Deltaproteobacteria bacterium]